MKKKLNFFSKTSKTSEIQLKEALMNKEKESNSSRKTDEEKHQSIPFLHETSILNHKEQMASNEENLNIVNNFYASILNNIDILYNLIKYIYIYI